MTLTELKALLAARGIRPLKRFGQNFLFDPNQQRWIAAQAAELTGGDLTGVRILEIGPGPGCLTEHLLDAGAQVLAVEIDRGLAAICRERFAERPTFRLLEADALQKKSALAPELVAALNDLPGAAPFPPGHAPLLLVANLPYQIAVPVVLLTLFHADFQLNGLVVTVQKEVAERLAGASGGHDYGPPAVVLGLLTRVELLKILPPQSFWPAPQIDSAVIRIRPRPDRELPDGFQCAWAERALRVHRFSRFLQALFRQRRKTLRKALQSVELPAPPAWDRLPVDPQARAEQLPPAQLLELFQALALNA
ncbi:MAG: 16S rRNA (adenine(1518)-N(6)/adenine(1519)-N(6))-dimethyltransferase RsmA [Planctomycetota bacterium]